jgi:DNA-binding MarR family transcriptional regulator
MPASVAKRLGYALKRAQHALRVSMDNALRPLGLTTPQYAVLSAVEAEPGLSNARLARAAFVTAQSMQGILANLERDGLLDRQPAPDHGRVLMSRLTPVGRRKLTEAHKIVQVVEDRMIAVFGADQASRIAAQLSLCADSLTAG